MQHPKSPGTNDSDSQDCEEPLAKTYLVYDNRNRYIYIPGLQYEEPEKERKKATSSLYTVVRVDGKQHSFQQWVLQNFTLPVGCTQTTWIVAICSDPACGN